MIALARPECPNPAALAAKDYKDPINKEVLRKSASGKCMYCENKIEHNSFAHVEHIKPKSKFPELEFVWENLGYCCQSCNTNKGKKYDKETPFIDPYNENPDDYLVFLGHLVYSKQGSERGEYTIKEIDLNRPELVDRRKDKIEGIDKMIKAAFRTSSESLHNQAIAELRIEAEKDREYSAAVMSVLVAQGIL
jgi:uncharacterized protein (TIGR02646 family)